MPAARHSAQWSPRFAPARTAPLLAGLPARLLCHWQRSPPPLLPASWRSGSNPFSATKKRSGWNAFLLAEKEGFEPSRQSPQPTPLAGEPLTATWVLLRGCVIRGRAPDALMPPNMTMPGGHSHIWRRERDSNPRCLAASPVFKTGSINHSDISPDVAFVL